MTPQGSLTASRLSQVPRDYRAEETRIKEIPPRRADEDVIIISSDYVSNSRSNAFAPQKGSVVPISVKATIKKNIVQKIVRCYRTIFNGQIVRN